MSITIKIPNEIIKQTIRPIDLARVKPENSKLNPTEMSEHVKSLSIFVSVDLPNLSGRVLEIFLINQRSSSLERPTCSDRTVYLYIIF